jgi:hypothetical protein
VKFIISIFLTALLSFVFSLYLPWWSIAFAAFAVAALLHQSPLKAFISGFLGLFFLWFFLSWIIDVNNKGILSHRVAALLPFGGSAFVLILITALIGAIVGGLSGLSGSFLRRTFQR